jgi:oligopeptidase B
VAARQVEPRSRRLLNAENEYTEQATADLAPLRQKIRRDKGAHQGNRPVRAHRRGDWWYYGRSFEGSSTACNAVALVADPDDWNLRCSTRNRDPRRADPPRRERRGRRARLFALGAATVSLDGNILAYSVTSRATSDTRCVWDLRPADCTTTRSAGIGAGATWAADNHTIYYVTVDDAWRPDTVWRHRPGAGLPAERVHHEPDEKFWFRGRPHPQQQVRHHRGGQRRHHRDALL